MQTTKESNTTAPMLEVTDLSKDFGSLQVLRDISFSLTHGNSLAITGPSGSGKSTLLHIIGTLEQPSRGRVNINNTDPFALPEPALARYRNAVIGFVFQDHHLLPQYSVLENVLIPTLVSKGQQNAAKRAQELLRRVELTHRISHRPAELSGGERQRAAVARALINQPRILLCDEPTGNLDRATSETIADLIFELHGAAQNILIVVTHNLEIASRFQQHLQLADGTGSVK